MLGENIDIIEFSPSIDSYSLDADINHYLFPPYDFIYGNELKKYITCVELETSFDIFYDKTISTYERGAWGTGRDWRDDDITIRVPTIPFPVKFSIKRYFQVWGKLTDDLFERAFVFESAEKQKIKSLKGEDYRGDSLIDMARLLANEQLKNEYPLIKKIFAKEAYRLLKLGLVRKNSQHEWTPVDIGKIYPEIPLLSSEAVAIIKNRARKLAKTP